MNRERAVDDLKTIRQIMERARRKAEKSGGRFIVLDHSGFGWYPFFRDILAEGRRPCQDLNDIGFS